MPKDIISIRTFCYSVHSLCLFYSNFLRWLDKKLVAFIIWMTQLKFYVKSKWFRTIVDKKVFHFFILSKIHFSKINFFNLYSLFVNYKWEILNTSSTNINLFQNWLAWTFNINSSSENTSFCRIVAYTYKLHFLRTDFKTMRG